MKALQLLQKEGRLEVHEVPYPAIAQSDDVIVRVAYAGICGTDLHAMAGEHPMPQTWMTLGHEFSGVVAEIGSGVTTCKVGDRVAVDPNIGCGKCRSCKESKIHFCQVGGSNNSIGFWRNGGWAEASVAPECCVHVIADALPLAEACLCEPLSCLIHGFDRAADVAQHGRTLVIGAGIIGVLTSCMLHFRGVRDVIISEPAAARRAFIDKLQLGFQTVTPAQAEEMFGGKSDLQLEDQGLDLVFDCSGFCPAVESAVTWLRSGGTLCLFGLPPPTGRVSISPHRIVSKELSVRGTIINPHTFPRAVSLAAGLREKYLDLKKLGCRVFNMDQYDMAIQALKRGEISKAVFSIDKDLK